MKTAITQLGRHTIIAPKEPVNHQNCNELEACVLGEAAKSPLAVILECKEVQYIDSAALETLLRLHDAVKERGSSMQLVGLNELCTDIMIATHMVNQFDIYSSVQEAIKEPL